MRGAKRGGAGILWRERLDRFAQSGWTVAEFCDWEGVSTAAFYQWRKKLLVHERSGAAVPDERSGSGQPLFVPVVPAAPASHDISSQVVVWFDNGTRVELPARDRGLVVQVIECLAAASAADGGAGS